VCQHQGPGREEQGEPGFQDNGADTSLRIDQRIPEYGNAEEKPAERAGDDPGEVGDVVSRFDGAESAG
jgi:hypothetical protein